MKRIMAIICLLTSTIASAQENFGRLFTTSTERANLDYLRKMAKDVSANEKPAPTNPQPTEITEETNAEPPAAIEMEGYVKRSDGKKGTVWINHQPIREGVSNGEVKVGQVGSSDNTIRLELSHGDKSVKLKAGQTYLPEKSQVKELNSKSIE